MSAVTPNLHGCNHNCLYVPEEIGIFTALQSSRKETIISETQIDSHIHKYMEKAQIRAQTSTFTLTDKSDANRNKQNMCLQLENGTEEAEYKNIQKQGTGQACKHGSHGNSFSVSGLKASR